MKRTTSSGTSPAPAWLGRAFCALALGALTAIVWLGWTGAGAQAALETLWVLCSAR